MEQITCPQFNVFAFGKLRLSVLSLLLCVQLKEVLIQLPTVENLMILPYTETVTTINGSILVVVECAKVTTHAVDEKNDYVQKIPKNASRVYHLFCQ